MKKISIQAENGHAELSPQGAPPYLVAAGSALSRCLLVPRMYLRVDRDVSTRVTSVGRDAYMHMRRVRSSRARPAHRALLPVPASRHDLLCRILGATRGPTFACQSTSICAGCARAHLRHVPHAHESSSMLQLLPRCCCLAAAATAACVISRQREGWRPGSRPCRTRCTPAAPRPAACPSSRTAALWPRAPRA
jgi:hypothetical protein